MAMKLPKAPRTYRDDMTLRDFYDALRDLRKWALEVGYALLDDDTRAVHLCKDCQIYTELPEPPSFREYTVRVQISQIRGGRKVLKEVRKQWDRWLRAYEHDWHQPAATKALSHLVHLAGKGVGVTLQAGDAGYEWGKQEMLKSQRSRQRSFHEQLQAEVSAMLGGNIFFGKPDEDEEAL